MRPDDELLFDAVSQGLQACIEALVDVANDLSEARRKQLLQKTARIQRAQAWLESMLEEREATR